MAEASEYRLHLPAVAESVALARLFLVTVLRSHEVEEALVDDAKLAVSELATQSVLTGGSDQFSVVATAKPEAIDVEVGPLDLGGGGDLAERLDVARALFPGIELDASTHTARYTIASVRT